MESAKVLYCPHCGVQLPALQTYSTKALQNCPHCKLEYYHKDIREPAFYDPPKYPKTIKQMVFLDPSGGFSFLFCHGLSAAFLWKGGFKGLPPTLALLGAGWFLHWYKRLMILIPLHKRYVREKAEYKASVARLADKAYILRLLDYGYKIHKFYLPARYPDLVDYKPPVKPKTKDGTIFYF